MDIVDNDSVETDWAVEVTDDDIRAAKRRWNEAQDSPTPENNRIATAYDDYRRLVIAQAQQLAENFRAQRAK